MKNGSRWVPIAILIIALGVLFYRLLGGEVIFWGTPLLQFYPWERMAFDAIRAGQLPLWNPMVGNGAPLLANYQTAVLYPPNWLYLLIPVEYGMGLLAVAHLVWAGVGMTAYLRRLGIGLLGQGVGAISFALSGYLIGRVGFPSVINAVAWLPWLMWSVECVIETEVRTRQWWRQTGFLAGIAAMQLLAGHAQTTFYSLVLVALYTVWRLVVVPRERRVGVLLAVGASLTLALLVAGAQLLPTAELMLASQRAGGIDSEAGLTYSFWPWRLLTLLAPNLFGTPAAGNFEGRAAYWEDANYVGLLTLVMAGHGIARWLRERLRGEVTSASRAAPFYLILFPLVFILALGSFSPVYMWLFDHNVPGIVTFQSPTRWTLLFEFGICTLAAVGIDVWQTSERGLFWTRLLTAGGGSFILASVLAARYAGEAVRSGFVPALAFLGGTIIAVGAVSLLLPQVEERPHWRPWWESVVLVVLAADLVVSHWGLNPTLPASIYHQPSVLAEAVKPYTASARYVYLPEDEHTVKFDSYLDFKDFRQGDLAHWSAFRGSLLPNLGMLDGVASASNFDPLLPSGQHQLVESLSELPEQDMIEQARRMNIGVILTASQRSDLQLIARSDAAFAYEIPDPWPRASIAECSLQNSALSCETSSTGSAEIVIDEPSRVEIAVTGDRDANVFLLDTYYPGWSAQVDGVPVDIRLANTAFRAVNIPAGTHRIVFTYAPASFLTGAILSALGLLGLGILVFVKGGLGRRGDDKASSVSGL